MAVGLLLVAGAPRMDIGTARLMGPGYFPLLVGAIAAGLGLPMFASALFGRGRLPRAPSA